MRMEQIDFEPKRESAVLVVLFAAVGALAGFGVFVTVRDLLEPSVVSWLGVLEAGFVLSVYALGLFFVLFYVLYSTRRFRFTEAGIEVITWRGRRFDAWRDFRRAQLSILRSGVFLELVIGRWTRILVPVSWFGRPALLVSEIRRRLAVPIEGADSAGAARMLGGSQPWG